MNPARECDRLAERGVEIQRERQRCIYARTDRSFAVLMLIQWAAAVVAALWLTPNTWDGAIASVHPHVFFAVALGGAFAALPVFFAWRRPGDTITRYTIAIAQVGFSSLLVHLTGGRIETHFHIFGSLAFLAAYRDWKVLVAATLIVATDHLIRGTLWPYSIFGVNVASPWRALEHAGWVIFEDVFLVLTVLQSNSESKSRALQTAHLESSHAELKRYADQLASSYEKEREIIEGALDAVVQMDRNGRVVSWNGQAERIFGWTAAEAIARPAAELIVPEALRADHASGLRAYLETGDSPLINQRLETVGLHRDGRAFPIEVAITPIDCGAEPLFCAFIRDITTRKATEVEMRQAKEQAEAANRTKSEFLANMSHEIRTPLNGILGFTELLIRNADDGDEAERRDYIKTIRTSGKHLLELINDILDLSKIEAGQLQVETAPCSPHHLIAEVVSVLRARAQEKGIQLDYRWDSEIPESIQSDPYRLRQLLMNLVGNAVKFTECGSVNVVARIVGRGNASRLVLEIRDTGIGIAPDHLEDVFKPFVQADNSVTRRFGGTGLGLTISKNICDSLGGSLSVQSELGKGATFTAIVPTGDLTGVAMGQRPPSAGSGDIVSSRQGAANLRGVRVLLADDGETNRKLIQLFLSRQGAIVVAAENGELAVAATMSQEFDLILMDMQMPVMDGYAATRKLRDAGFERPIIALTAHAMLGDRRKCEEAGCSGYVTKPVNVDELIRVIQAAVRGTRPLSEVIRPVDCVLPAPPEAGAIHSALPVDDAEIRELVAEFAATVPERIDSIERALATLDFDGIASMAHALKGAGGTAGFQCLTDISARIEKSAQQKHSEEIAAMLGELRGLNQRIVV
ncbi:MAG TPA: ATP-binding protein [Lacipirellulaceae bacterium]|nr:ATP-binding protein [Lacipirellulaceae bacterium]